uniref:Uncharacterized protein n=1 Tax=Rhizophora mucronata TaxID=61149 RepID=A0A2P2LSZ4_RHIMU
MVFDQRQLTVRLKKIKIYDVIVPL